MFEHCSTGLSNGSYCKNHKRGELLRQTKQYTRLLMFLLIIGCLAACGNSQSTVTESGMTEGSTNNESESTSPDGESTPEVSDKENTTTIKSETEDGKSTSTEITEGKSIPEDFPKHIPLPEDVKVTGSLKNTIDGLETFMLSLTTEMGMEDFHKIYTDYVKEKNIVK